MNRLIGTINGHAIEELPDGSVIFTSGATLDGDGANGQFGGPPCYAPIGYKGVTLDVIGNAGGPGNWYGVVTDAKGHPFVQTSDDPCPGAHVSATSLHLPWPGGNARSARDPFKYVDSSTVPFIVVPPMIVKSVKGIVMGCRATVTNSHTGQTVEAVVGDGGPRDHLGEISVACARAIGVPTGGRFAANSGGADSGIHYQIWPGVPAVVNGVTYPLQGS